MGERLAKGMARKPSMKNQGRLGFEYEVAKSNSQITAHGGLPLVVETMATTGVIDAVAKHITLGQIQRQFGAASCVQATVLLMAAGGDCLDDMRQLREDGALCELLGGKLPSPETLRNFLYAFHSEELVKAAPGKKARVPLESPALQGLAEVVKAQLAHFQVRFPQSMATLDIDGTIIESHKKQATVHYEGGRGYQPVVACWAETGLAVADEFRDGNVPGHHRPLEMVVKAFAALPDAVQLRRLRGDTALYSPLLMEWLQANDIEFAIGAKMRSPLRAACEAVPESHWQKLETRADTILYIAEVEYRPRASQGKPLRYVGIRMVPRQVDLLDQRETKYLAVVTNRTLPLKRLVRWYWAKAGTVEKLHDVVKNELAGGVLPCGRFGANAAWFRLALLTNNILQTLKLVAPDGLRDARPKRLRFSLLSVPALVVHHARAVVARLANAADAAMRILQTRNRLWLAADHS